MAEDVQAALDDMVPALKELQDRGIFSAEEIHLIVDRRRNSEYDLRRKQAARKADFLRYIEAEMHLEELRKLRTQKVKQLEREKQEKQQQKQNGADVVVVDTKLSDLHITKLIHSLWRRTLYKFGKSDVSLYLQYAEYCKGVQANTQLSRILAESLQLYPHEEGLWAEAASHEFFGLGSIHNARVLMQQGIRLNQNSQDLWLQFFCLELHFLEKMRARKTILLGGGDEHNEEDEGKEEEKVDNEDPHKIAKLVYQNAVKSIPSSVDFRLKFWDQCRLFSDTDDLKKYIVDSIRKDLCKNNPDAWMAWALYQWQNKPSTRALQGQPEEAAEEGDEGSDEGDKGIKEEDDNGETAEERQGRDEVDKDNKDVDVKEMEEDEKESKLTEGKKRKNPHKKEEDDADEETSNKETSAKKPRLVSEPGNDASVLDILRQATKALPTEEMYLKATRMIARYIAHLQEEETDDDEDEHPDISAGIEILEKLFDEASESDFFSAELVMEQALFLSRCGRREDSAKSLQKFADKNPTENALKVWIYLAEISEDGAVAVLSKALEKTDMNHPTYYEFLLHLFGAKLQAKDDTDLMSLFEKIVLLTPGFLPMTDIEEPVFGVRQALDASLQFLQYLKGMGDVAKARKVYKTVVIESSLGSTFVEFDDSTMVSFIEEAASVEMGCKDEKKPILQQNLVHLYDKAVKLFGENSYLAIPFKEKRRESRLGNWGPPNKKIAPHCLGPHGYIVDARDKVRAKATFEDAFDMFQLVHLRNAHMNRRGPTSFGWESIGDLFGSLNEKDKESWCVETPGDNDSKQILPAEFLQARSRRGYCSFLVQHDKEAFQKTLASIPLEQPIPGVSWRYPSEAFWIFFGNNPPQNPDLAGRPDHTDSIWFDGTWHFQVSGRKIWYLRPSLGLLTLLSERKSPGKWDENSRIRIECNKGDVICVNTRLWFHRTIIPPQSEPSVSYARDFYKEAQPRESGAGYKIENGEGMKNVDGMYATNHIEAGTIIFTEHDMPDCELHRSSTDPNCQVVEMENGTSALVSVRAIHEGEFFCVAESSDDDKGCDDNYETVEEEELDEQG